MITSYETLHYSTAEITSDDGKHGPTKVTAEVRRYANDEKLMIKYSHTCRPSQQSGLWFSDSFTSAHNLDEARALIAGWFKTLEGSYEIVEWAD